MKIDEVVNQLVEKNGFHSQMMGCSLWIRPVKPDEPYLKITRANFCTMFEAVLSDPTEGFRTVEYVKFNSDNSVEAWGEHNESLDVELVVSQLVNRIEAFYLPAPVDTSSIEESPILAMVNNLSSALLIANEWWQREWITYLFRCIDDGSAGQSLGLLRWVRDLLDQHIQEVEES